MNHVGELVADLVLHRTLGNSTLFAGNAGYQFHVCHESKAGVAARESRKRLVWVTYQLSDASSIQYPNPIGAIPILNITIVGQGAVIVVGCGRVFVAWGNK